MARDTNEARWGTLSAADRATLIDELNTRAESSTGKHARLYRAAAARLEVRPRPKQKHRPPATYQQSPLRQRLSLPESRPAAIASVVAAIKAAGSIDAAAPMLGISRRSLYRALNTYEDLRTAVDGIKSGKKAA